ncbi:MAG TPA: hypothetical protein VNF00_04180 [Candidatus Acidoferrales bacterium]|nr:hypothetical protein [Candidatus Acidoferrales bacterium]
MKDKPKISIFYAWETDLPTKFNRYAIKKALRSASAELEEKFSTDSGKTVEIVIDEATRDLPGSPHIPTAILTKIRAADVFVGDVSLINTNQLKTSSGTPNPNVVFELGYAVAYLGWERVLLLLNEVHGPVEKLPFDFDRQRVSRFKLAEGGIGSHSALVKLLTTAISLVLQKNPKRPSVKHSDPKQVQRERDLSNLRRLLESVHWPTIDAHISKGAKYLSTASTVFFECLTTPLLFPLRE